MGDAEELLDISQAALFLQVSETSLRRWTDAGRLACLRVGLRRERRFRRADLLAFMEAEPARIGAGAAERPAGTGAHFCTFYSSDSGRAALASAFVTDGLDAGSVCLLVATREARANVIAYVQQARPSVAEDIAAGRLVLSDYSTAPQAQYDYFELQLGKALRGGATSLRVVGDVSGGGMSGNKKFDDVLDYESGYSHLIAHTFPVRTLCLYDARILSGIDVLAVLKCHPDTLQLPREQLLR